MIFRMKKGSYVNNIKNSFSPLIDKYLELALTELIYAELDEENIEYNSKFKERKNLYATKNIPEGVKTLFKIRFQNPVEREHTFLELIQGYLKGMNMDGVTPCPQYTSSKSDVLAFDPSKSTKENSENYDIYSGKIGLIYQGFHYYLIYKPNRDYIYHKANKWGVLREGNVDGDGGEDRVSGVIYSDAHEETYYVDEDRFDTLVDRRLICKDIFRTFYEGKVNSSEITDEITKAYNMVLTLELMNLGHLRKGLSEGILYPTHIGEKELNNLEHLVDSKYKDRFLSGDTISKHNEWERLENLKGRKFEILTIFFGMLVESGIRMEINSNEYMTTLVEFQNTTVKDIDDFKQVMENTKLQSSKYPIFPLLEGTSLEEVVRKSKFGDKRKYIPTPEEYEKSLEQASFKSTTELSLNLTPRLKRYLEEVLNLEFQRYSEIVHPHYVREVAPGVNEGTVKKETFEIISKILYPEGGRVDKKVMDFVNIYPLLKNEDRRLNIEHRSEGEIHDILLDLVLQPQRVTGIPNKERMQNLWVLINNAKEHLLKLESINGVQGVELESNPLVEYIQLKKHGKYLTEVKIPKIKYPIREATITLYDVIDLTTSGDFTEAQFYYQNQKYVVTLEGVVKSLTEEYLTITHSINRQLEMNKNMGNDYQMIATDPIQSLGLSLDLINKANNIKEPPPKKEGTNEYDRYEGWRL